MTLDSILTPAIPTPVRWSTEDVPRGRRSSWLREVIGREYTRVEITPPRHGLLFNEMTIHSWAALRLSVIRSGALGIERRPEAPVLPHEDAYFAVVLLSGAYRLEQGDDTAVLKPGDMALYDATRPHRIECPGAFSKLIVSIPRKLLRERLPWAERCTARAIRGQSGTAAIAVDFIRSIAARLAALSYGERGQLCTQAVDLLTLTFGALAPASVSGSRVRSASLALVKQIVERRLSDPGLAPEMVSRAARLSARYINELFNAEGTSLMRYVRDRRLSVCRRDLRHPAYRGQSISTIAYRWGFNDVSHFTRVFRLRYGCAPGETRR